MWKKLRLKLLWLRHTYPFLWAHKPLCNRFEHDVIRVAHVHVCRSCTCVYAGIALSLILLAMGWLPSGPIFLLGFAALTALVLGGSHPRFYWRWPRKMRDALRFGAGLVIGMAAALLIRGEWIPGVAVAAILYASWTYYKIRRKRKKNRACDGCPELRCGAGICSGFSKQAVRIRRYEEEATALIMREWKPLEELRF